MRKFDESEVNELERKFESLPSDMFCIEYNKLVIVSIRNPESKNRRAVLMHVPNCEHKFCKLVSGFFKGVIDDKIFMNMVSHNISKDEEQVTKEWK